jgi:hypothetical protein
MRWLGFLGFPILFILVVGGGACGDNSGFVLSTTDDGGTTSLPDCVNGPNFTGCGCEPGETRACYTGPPATRGLNGCKDGLQSCGGQGGESPTYAFGTCTGEILPLDSGSCTITDGGQNPSEGGACAPIPCPAHHAWDSLLCTCVAVPDAGCLATPAPCAVGYVFDPLSCQCVPGSDGGIGCGGFAGIPCPTGFYCDNFPANDPCGGGDSMGTCTPRPLGCTTDCPGACGCDHKTYCNACEAHNAGVRHLSFGRLLDAAVPPAHSGPLEKTPINQGWEGRKLATTELRAYASST